MVAMISSNLKRAGRKPRVFIEKGTTPWLESGLLVSSVVLADNISTVRRERLIKRVGSLSDMSDVDAAIRHALNL